MDALSTALFFGGLAVVAVVALIAALRAEVERERALEREFFRAVAGAARDMEAAMRVVPVSPYRDPAVLLRTPFVPDSAIWRAAVAAGVCAPCEGRCCDGACRCRRDIKPDNGLLVIR